MIEEKQSNDRFFLMLAEEAFVDTFARRMIEIAGIQFENGRSIEEYARMKAQIYRSNPAYKGKSPEECADIDVASWTEAGDRTIARVEMMHECMRLIRNLLAKQHVPKLPAKDARAVALQVAEIMSAFPMTDYPPLKHEVAVKLLKLRKRRPDLTPFMKRSFTWAGCVALPQRGNDLV